VSAIGKTGGAAELVDRLFHDMIGALELFTVYLGERLGLYRALEREGPATSAELAGRTGTAERYVREWLEHHAASGLLEVDDPAADPLARRYRLPAAYVPVLADPDDTGYRAYHGVEVVRAGRMLAPLVEAFRTGEAPPPLPWAPEGRAEYNRADFLNLLGTQWLPAIPDVDQRLRREPPARVADLACGAGWSSIAIAQAYPLVRIDGFDLDPDVIAAAGRNALQAGMSDRVTFTVADVSGPGFSGPGFSGRFDLVTIFEGLHDMSRPVEALRAARGLLTPSGSVVIADELVAETFTAPASDLERYHYGWSVVACLPGAMGDPGTAATGAVMRPATLSRYARSAGFARTEVLPLQTEVWQFYRLIPLGVQGDPEAVFAGPAAVRDAAVGQDHPARGLVLDVAGQQDPVQPQRAALREPGGQHPGRVALPPPGRHHVVPDVPADLGQFRGELVTDDERAQVVLARDVPEDGGRHVPADLHPPPGGDEPGEVVAGRLQPLGRCAAEQAVGLLSDQVRHPDILGGPHQPRRFGETDHWASLSGWRTLCHAGFSCSHSALVTAYSASPSSRPSTW
jgi:2-polyprenyl-3-methyl-5-hydroxy-6-metoxy-1,4-benzoquinol methylase